MRSGCRPLKLATVTSIGVLQSQSGGQGEYGGRSRFSGRAVAGHSAAVLVTATGGIAKALPTSSKVARRPHAARTSWAPWDSTCAAARALLIRNRHMDRHPSKAGPKFSRAARASTVESNGQRNVLHRRGGALGPGLLLLAMPFIAQRCADSRLLAQSHAEHDLAALGQSVKGPFRKVVQYDSNPVLGGRGIN